MWEIASREVPWADIEGSFILNALLAHIRAEVRPPVPRDCPAAYAALMWRCWATQAHDRPSFAEIIADPCFAPLRLKEEDA